MSKKKISTTVAFALATASVAVSATAAQASVEWHSNGVLVGTTPVGTTFWGEWEVQNAFLGNIKCGHVLGTLAVRNEGGLAKGAVEMLAVGNCYTSGPHPCPGIFMTAEAPVEAIFTERLTEKGKHEPVATAQRGPFSLPWQAEGTEKVETELFKRVSISGVKLTVVAPCFSTEIPFEGTLEATVVNGSRNGLKPTRLLFGETGGRRVSLITKDLATEKELNSLFVKGEVKDNGESVQLMTLE